MQPLLRISEAANLALHAMARLASEGGRLSAAQMAGELRVSESHLCKVLYRLAKLGLVASVRGAKGGFSLKCPPGETTLAEIIEAVDGPMSPATCLFGTPVCRSGRCVLSGLLESVNSQVSRTLGSTTLEDFAVQPLASARVEDAERQEGQKED